MQSVVRGRVRAFGQPGGVLGGVERGVQGRDVRALMESAIGLYKTELIKPRGPWNSLTDVEIATAEWVDWYNTTEVPPRCGER